MLDFALGVLVVGLMQFVVVAVVVGTVFVVADLVAGFVVVF